MVFTYSWTNTKVSLKQRESLISVLIFILQPTDHRELKRGTTHRGYPEFFSIDLAINVVRGNQRINCQTQLALFECSHRYIRTEYASA